MQAATVEALDIEIHGILKGHGRKRQALMPQAIEESVKIHFIGKFTVRSRFIRQTAPVAGNILPVILLTPPRRSRMRNRGQRLQIPGRCDQKVCMEPTERVVTPGWHETFQGDSRLIADIHHQTYSDPPPWEIWEYDRRRKPAGNEYL